MNITKLESNKYIGFLSCEECPSFNSLETMTEGQELDVDHPLYGGKAKVSFKTTGENKFLTTITSEAFGVTEVDETYTDEGATLINTHKKSGASIKEFWPREVNETAWYRMTKAENVENFMKAIGFPTVSDYKFKLNKSRNFCGTSKLV